MTDVIEYVRRFNFNKTNLNTTHKRKHRFGLYLIIENDFGRNSYDQMETRL